jgi:ankyrin repeat protein
MQRSGDLRARIDKRCSHGGTPLEYAVERGHMRMFRFLIDAGASQKAIAQTLLELACRKGQRDIAASLIDMGYNVNVRTQSLSATKSVYLTARWLPGAFSEGLDTDSDTWSFCLRDVGEQQTILSTAATYGHTAVIKLLLDRGAFVNAATTKGFTPLHAASYQGHTECVETLVQRGATIMSQTTEGWLAFHFAALRGKLPVIEMFLDMGVSLGSTTTKAKTALHLAAFPGHAEVVRTLVERGANLELGSHKGETALHLATRNGKPQVVEILLSSGANRNAVTKKGQTALQLAQSRMALEGKECQRILLGFGTTGYEPWQPPIDSDAAVAEESITAADAEQVTNDGREPSRRDSETSVSTQSSFTPATSLTSYPRKGFQSELTSSVQYRGTQPLPGSSHTPPQPPQTAQPSSLNRVQSEPTYHPSRFTYSSNATMQDLRSPQYHHCDPPPPYASPVPGSGFQALSHVQEKSPSTTISDHGTWPDPPPVQTAFAPPALVPSQAPHSMSMSPSPNRPFTPGTPVRYTERSTV